MWCANTGWFRRNVNMCEYRAIQEERSICVNTGWFRRKGQYVWIQGDSGGKVNVWVQGDSEGKVNMCEYRENQEERQYMWVQGDSGGKVNMCEHRANQDERSICVNTGWFWKKVQYVWIQSDSGGKVNILGVLVSVIVRKYVDMNVCLILSGYRDSCINTHIKKHCVWMVIKIQKLLTINSILV